MYTDRISNMDEPKKDRIDKDDDARNDPFKFFGVQSGKITRNIKISNINVSPLCNSNASLHSSIIKQEFESNAPTLSDHRRSSNQNLAGPNIDDSPLQSVSQLRAKFELNTTTSNKQPPSKTPLTRPPIVTPTEFTNSEHEASNGHLKLSSDKDIIEQVNEDIDFKQENGEIPVIFMDENDDDLEPPIESYPYTGSGEEALGYKPVFLREHDNSSVESMDAILPAKNTSRIVEIIDEDDLSSADEISPAEIELKSSIALDDSEHKETSKTAINQHFDSAIELEDPTFYEVEEDREEEISVIIENKVSDFDSTGIEATVDAKQNSPVNDFTQPISSCQNSITKSNIMSDIQRQRLRNMLVQQTLKEDAEFDDSGAPLVINFRSDTVIEVTNQIKYPIELEVQHGNVREDFEILESLGTGKFGHVHRCHKKTAENDKVQQFAAKFVKTRKVQRAANGYIMEVAILCAIGKHPQIAAIVAAYEENLQCCILTEIVEGGALYDRIYEDANLTEQVTVKFVRQMLLGLQHLERCSVLHRDLKPENLMLVNKESYRLKIIDFGFACFYDKSQPPKLLAGTPAYSAPETLNYDSQSFATDLWSVAVIAYEILSGITPFEVPQIGDDLERVLDHNEIMTNISLVRFNFNDEGVSDASNEAKSFISSILVKKPDQRPDVDACLQHSWISMPEAKLPKIQRTVSLVRRTPGSQSFRFKHNPLRLTAASMEKEMAHLKPTALS